MTHDVVVRPHPFGTQGQQIHVNVLCGPQDTLLTVLQRAQVPLERDDWVVTVEGVEVHPAMVARTRPKPGMLIECRRRPGEDAFRAIAQIALTIAVIWVSITFGPYWAAALAVTGQLLINKVFPPPALKLPNYKDRTEQQIFQLSGGRNSARPFEPIPLLMGEMRVLPDYASQPFSWFDGEDQYQYIRLHAGIGTGSVEALRIGETAIESYSDVEVTQAGFPGSPLAVLQEWASVDSIVGGLLDAPTAPGEWVIRTSSVNSVRLAVDLQAQLYTMEDDGSLSNATLQFELQRRLLPSGPWTVFMGGTVRKTMTSRSTTPVRQTYMTEPLAPGQYEVRMRKFDVNVTTTRSANVIEWVSLKSYQEDTTDYTGQPMVGIRIRASGQLNGTLDQVTWLGKAAGIPDWNGSTWVTRFTRNPGSWFLKFARGFYDDNGRLQAGMGLPDSLIDVFRIRQFSEHCTARGYTFDAWITTATSCFEVLEAIAATGLGSVSYDSGKLGVVWLADDQPIECVVGMGNIRQGSFSVDYTALQAAEEIEISWPERADEFRPATLRVKAPGVTVPASTARLAPVGLTTQAGALAAVRIAMAQNLYQRKTITWEQDLEHLDVRRYTLCRFGHDITQWAHSGRVAGQVTNAGVVTLTLDEPVPFVAGATAPYIGLRIPGESGYRVFQVQAFTGPSREVTLVGAWPAGVPKPGSSAGNPAHDTIYIYDFAAQPGQRLRIVSIEPESDLRGARITAVPEPDEFWTYFNTGAFELPPTPPARQALAVSNVQVTQSRLDLSYDKTTELAITWEAVGPYFEAQVWGGPDGQALRLLGTTQALRFPWRVPSDGIVDIEVRPFDSLGRPGVVGALSHNVTLNALVSTSKLLRLSATSQVFMVPASGTTDPASITFQAYGTNLGGSPVFTVTSGTATLSGGGSSRTLLAADLATDSATIQVAWDGLVDQITVVKVREGSTAFSPFLTNESAVVAADQFGVVSSFAGVGGEFKVYRGADELTTGVVYSVVSETGLDVSINAATGVYTVASMSADSADAIFRATIGTSVLDKVYSLAKSRAGVDARVLTLLTSSQVFQVNKAGTASPGSIVFTAYAPTLSGSPTFTVTAGTATLTGSGTTRTLTFANLATDSATVQATWGGFTDQVTVVKLREGSDAINPLLTNQSANVAADADGVVSSFANAGGEFRVWRGATEITSGVTYSVVSETSLDITINSSTGIYSVASMTADAARATLRAVVDGANYDIIYTLTRSRTGDAAISSSLSKYSIVLPAGSDGEVSSYSGASTAMSVKKGASTDTGWTFSRTATAGITTTIAGATVTVTDMSDTLDAGTITITATKAGNDPEVQTCAVSKAKSPKPTSGVIPMLGTLSSTITEFEPTNPQARVEVRSNGQLFRVTPLGGLVAFPEGWFTPPTTGIGAAHWIRAKLVSGEAPTLGALNTWQQISSNRLYGLSETASSGLPQTASCLLSIEIATDSSGSDVVSTGFISLTATKESSA